MRYARDFEPQQADVWIAAANTGRDLGFPDLELLAIIRMFGHAIWLQSDTLLTEPTERRIRRFVRWVERPSGVRFNIDDGTPVTEEP